MSAVCVSQSGTGGGGLELEQGGGWGEVPSTGVAPAGRTPAFLEAASPPKSARPMCFWKASSLSRPSGLVAGAARAR